MIMGKPVEDRVELNESLQDHEAILKKYLDAYEFENYSFFFSMPMKF